MKKSERKKYSRNKQKGKKKKNEPVHTDGSTMVQYCLIKLGLINYEPDFPSIYQSLHSQVANKETLNQPGYLKALMIQLEEMLEHKVRDQNLYEMIFWSRRIRPANVYQVSSGTVYMYRELTQLIYVKYCKAEFNIVYKDEVTLPKSLAKLNLDRLLKIIREDEPPTNDESIVLREVSMLFNLCYEIEALAYYYVYLMQRYRICCKGGHLVHDPKLGIDCTIDGEAASLIDLYDQRVNKSNVLAGAGGFASLRFSGDLPDPNFSIIAYQENLEEIRVKEYYNQFLAEHRHSMPKSFEFIISDNYITNYFPRPVDLSDYYKYAKMYSQEFQAYYGFSVEEFLIFMTKLSSDSFSSFVDDPMRLDHMFKRGYMIYRIDEIKRSYIASISSFQNALDFEPPEDPEASFHRLFTYFSYDWADSAQVNLQTFGPRKIFYPFDSEKGIIDHSGWIGLLSYTLDPICKEEDRKGDLFEDIVIEIIKKAFGEDSIWVVKKTLKAGKRNREIDVSFVYRDVLIILECKAINLSWGFFSGDIEAINFRNMKNKKAIDQADKTLAFICDNHGNLNASMPTGIQYVASLIVSPHPEYIWSADHNLFIDSITPRILAAKELNEVFNEALVERLKQAPFCRKIKEEEFHRR